MIKNHKSYHSLTSKSLSCIMYGLIINLCFFITSLYGINFHDFDSYQNRLTKDQVEFKIKTYLQKDEAIQNFYKITEKALYIGDPQNQQIDYILYFTKNISSIKNKTIKRLQQAKIAIDPGHFGGLFAELEERYVTVPINIKDSISFNEGTLTYLTALALKSLLENAGAKVFITRSGIGQGAIEETFFEWLQKHPIFWKSPESLSQLFRNHYNCQDLIARAQKINAFVPDVTVVIHYNAHLTELEKEQKKILSKTNYSLIFIPGAFCDNELNTPEKRYEFLRLIVTDDLEKSLKLGKLLADQFVKQLKVKLISDEKTSYLAKCIFQQPGIYSRNLVLTRMVHSPVCYGESLVQNNESEVYRLASHEINIDGYLSSKRIQEVAQAYFKSLKKYFEDN